MARYRLNAKGAAGATVDGYTDWVGTNLTNIIDQDTGLPSDVSVTVTGTAFTAATSGSWTNTSHYGVPEAVWDNQVYTNLAGDTVVVIQGTDIAPGSSWTWTFAAMLFSSSSDRATTLHINGVDLLYNNVRAPSTPMTPIPPVSADVTAEDAGGGIGRYTLTLSGTNTFKAITLLDFAPAAVPTLTYVNGGDTIIAGETFTWNPSNFTPTAATISGVACSAVTLSDATPPGYVNGAAFPSYNDQCTLTATEDAISVNLTVKFRPPADKDYVIMSGTLATGTGTLKSFYPDLAVDDEVTFPRRVGSVFNAIDAAGNILSDVTEPQTWFVRSDATGLLEEIDMFVGGSIPDPEITSVGTIRIGSTTAITVSNFSGAVNAGTIDGINLETASDTEIKTFSIADGDNVPRPGTRSLYLTDGTDNDAVDATVTAPSGWSSYTITADFVESVNGVAGAYLPVGWAEGDFILTPSTSSASDTGISTGLNGTQELFLVDAVTGLATSFDITTTGGGGGSGSVGFGVRGLSLRGL